MTEVSRHAQMVVRATRYGIVWAAPEVWAQLSATIPSFAPGMIGAYLQDLEPVDIAPGAAATPGGYKAFEHRWAVAEAFAFSTSIGRDRVAERTHEQATQLKEGLAELSGMRVITPRDPALSAGIVCLEVEDTEILELPAKLRERPGLVASVTPYCAPYVRLGPSIVTSPKDVEAAIQGIATVR